VELNVEAYLSEESTSGMVVSPLNNNNNNNNNNT